MEEEKVWMASHNLELVSCKCTGRFKDLLHLRYGPPLHSNPLHELVSCKRTGTIADYQDRFQALLPHAGRLDEEQRIQLFTRGLQLPLSLDVEVHNPQTLAGAMSLARKLELWEQYTVPAPRAATRGLLPAPPQRLALPAAPGANPPGPNTITVEGWPIKRLSMAKQEEHRRLGLCYNCDEKFVRGHNRVCKCLFLLDGAVEDAKDLLKSSELTAAEEESPLFSLHTIAGVRFTDTM
jgi:hypothetical protein